MVWLRVLALKTTFWLVESLWQPIRSFYSVVFEANTHNKMEHTIWKGMENCAWKWCHFLCTILFEVTWAFCKMWHTIPEILDLPPSMGTFSKRHFNKREIWSLKDVVGGSAHGLWQKILTDYKFNNTPLLRQHVLSAATIHPFINAQKCWFMYPLLFNNRSCCIGRPAEFCFKNLFVLHDMPHHLLEDQDGI